MSEPSLHIGELQTISLPASLTEANSRSSTDSKRSRRFDRPRLAQRSVQRSYRQSPQGKLLSSDISHKQSLSMSDSIQPTSSLYPSLPLSGSAPELRNPPINPRHSRRYCTSFEEHEIDETPIDFSTPTSPSPTLPLASSSNSGDFNAESLPPLMPPFDDSSSETSSFCEDIESAFPQPPPMPSPLLRRMKSTPRMHSAEELMDILISEASLSYKHFDLPPVPPLSIQKHRGSVSSRSTSNSTKYTSENEALSLRDNSHATDAGMEHRRSSTARPHIPRHLAMEESTTKDTLVLLPLMLDQEPSMTHGSTPRQKSKWVHRQAMSLSTSSGGPSFFERAKLGTRRSFAHFRRPPASSPADLPPLPSMRNPSSIALPIPPMSPPTSASVPVIRKVASMREPGRTDLRRGGSPERVALDRLEDSIAKLRAIGADPHAVRMGRGHRSHHSSLVNRSPDMTPRSTHRIAQSESASRSPGYPYLQQPPHGFSQVSSRGDDESSIPFPKSGSGNSKSDNLRSFIDITPERDFKTTHKDKMKRLLANAGQLIRLGRSSAKT